MKDDVVHVSAPARLHLGFLDPGAHYGRRFGGIGLALDAPATRLSIARSNVMSVTGPEADRVGGYLSRLTDVFGLGSGYRVVVEEAIPAHAGLGSGTQLAVALAVALRTLEARPLDIAGDATILGRGKRSGLGAAFFRRGGIAVDGGKGEEDVPPPLVAQFDFPADWRIILVLDADTVGVHGEAELEAFKSLPRFSKADAGEIAALTMMQVLPGVIEEDIAAFGSAITRIQALVGAHFAPAQGGVFASPRVARTMLSLVRHGAVGIGQSSWGPTGFAFAASDAAARRIVEATLAEGSGEGIQIRIAKGRNGGATVERAKPQQLAPIT